MLQELKCVIVDDDNFMVEMLNDLCKKIPYVKITNSFNCPDEFLKSLADLDFDVCLLDINMPGKDGLFVARQISDKHVIFVTGQDDKLRDALGSMHFDIVIKPINIQRLNETLLRAYELVMGRKSNCKEYRLFNIAGSKAKVKLKLSDIFLVTTDNEDTGYKHLFLKDGERYTVTECTLEDLCMCSKLFVQPNKSELITIDAIHQIVGNKIIILNNIKEKGAAKQVVLSRSFRDRFFAQV